MRRTLWMVVTLVLVVGWLLLSYLPGLLPSLPALSYPQWSLWLLGLLAAAGAIGFLAIQIWIVWSTDRALVAAAPVARAFRLRRAPEAVWTALPILFTLLLVGALIVLRQPA